MFYNSLCFFNVFLYAVFANAYGIDTHAAITDKACEESILSSLNFQQTFGIPAKQLFNPLYPANGAIATKMKPIPSHELVPKTADGMIRFGSMAEDDGERPLNHFMDTQNGNEKFIGILLGNTAE